MLQLSSTVLPALGALAAVLALILLAGRAVRLTGLTRIGLQSRANVRPQRLLLQDTLALDRVRRLHVVRCGNRELVLLTGGTTDFLVGWLPSDGDCV